MRDRKTERATDEGRRALEIEQSQKALRASISKTERLVHESEQMLRRHRKEREHED